MSGSNHSTVSNYSFIYQEMMSKNVSPLLIHLLLLMLPQLLFGFLAPDLNQDTPRLTLLNVDIYLPTVHDCMNDQKWPRMIATGNTLVW